MEEGNLLCETENCGKPAVAFGLKATTKSRSCEEHMAGLLRKGMQIYDIAGYFFITHYNDVEEFEARRIAVSKGRGNLTVLEASCELELTQALRAIENAKFSVIRSVENRFEEMRVAVTKTCDEVRTQFAEVKLNFAQFYLAKENQISPLSLLMCADLSTVPKVLRFGVADASDRVSAVLDDTWAVSTSDIHSTLKCLEAGQKQTLIENALSEASIYAKKRVQEALQYADFLIGEETLLEEVQTKVIKELLKCEKIEIKGNLKWLQHSWDLRQRYHFSDRATVKIGQRLASLLSLQHRQFSKAEGILQHCYALAQAQNSLSEDALSICTEIIGVYAATADYQRLDQFGTETLSTFADAGHPDELYWTILLYVTYSMRQRSQKLEAKALIDCWRNREVRNGSKFGEMLRLLTYAIESSYDGNVTEAERLLTQARHIGISTFPTSFFTALVLSRLGSESSKYPRMELHRQAESIYETVAPKSFDSASNLNNMGLLFFKVGLSDEAEDCCKQARATFELVAPKSVDAAISLNNLAILSEHRQRLNQADEYYRQAREVHNLAAPKSLCAAKNLACFADFNRKRGRIKEAVECFEQARAIYELTAPQSVEAGDNLALLGQMLVAMGLIPHGIEYLREAGSIFAANGKTEQKRRTEVDIDLISSLLAK